ncbi:hypothetical protein B9Q11_02315 [Candidatus Marsarchaeota G2 archaeon ECH_B_SAG-F08]|uniref:Uncharacterized protein n=2 Tax=Candidatus Marsarchaeota group 2 TaxID=2203771 RepID=A0A2R6C206_9ARCH|nr:MAG: hypothetical protein B9Q11_02315 [Candidatus Marsarchaeota G2 archaeon ECH_B_SAG-F08]PSO04945.1 MAG: hypothetical protein B9Q12_01450 [Candidatus Marsarchaeota G2 archaeon ECH_B_SAG-G06]
MREALPIWKNLYGVTNESREEQPGQPTQQKPERAISVDVRLSILVTLPDGRLITRNLLGTRKAQSTAEEPL